MKVSPNRKFIPPAALFGMKSNGYYTTPGEFSHSKEQTIGNEQHQHEKADLICLIYYKYDYCNMMMVNVCTDDDDQ